MHKKTIINIKHCCWEDCKKNFCFTLLSVMNISAIEGKGWLNSKLELGWKRQWHENVSLRFPGKFTVSLIPPGSREMLLKIYFLLKNMNNFSQPNSTLHCWFNECLKWFSAEALCWGTIFLFSSFMENSCYLLVHIRMQNLSSV